MKEEQDRRLRVGVRRARIDATRLDFDDAWREREELPGVSKRFRYRE